MNTKIWITAFAIVASIIPVTALAEQTPVTISSSYNTDSDGVKNSTVTIATAKERNPFNFSYSRLKIQQRDSADSVDENALKINWNYRINEERGYRAWVNLSQNNIWNHASYGLQYYGVANTIDKVTASYSHEAVQTLAAYQNCIMGDNLAMEYRQEIYRDLTLDTKVKYASYSDSNYRKSFSTGLTKAFGRHYRVGLMYDYDTSDVNKKSVFYLPKQQSSLSLTMEAAVKIGEGSLLLKRTGSLFSRDVTGRINKTTYGVTYRLRNLNLGLQYYKDDNYWAREFSCSWSNRW